MEADFVPGTDQIPGLGPSSVDENRCGANARLDLGTARVRDVLREVLVEPNTCFPRLDDPAGKEFFHQLWACGVRLRRYTKSARDPRTVRIPMNCDVDRSSCKTN